ncbi:MAG: hypothetical protein IKH57_25655 [Clostridia bacterium]|nr:hypothetical protein [Clostridia bacterium]
MEDNHICKPILFNTEMVRAILDGRKTQTRRLVKPHYHDGDAGFNVVTMANTGAFCYIEYYDEDERSTERRMNPPYNRDDILWVRETWRTETVWQGSYIGYEIAYKAGGQETFAGFPPMLPNEKGFWHPSIHMPKKAARIFLQVKGVHAERLQDIDEDSVCDEGAERIISACEHMDYGVMPPEPCFNVKPCNDCIINHSYPELFGKMIWDKTLKKADIPCFGWDANPWVWVIEFERCEKPEGWPT